VKDFEYYWSLDPMKACRFENYDRAERAGLSAMFNRPTEGVASQFFDPEDFASYCVRLIGHGLYLEMVISTDDAEERYYLCRVDGRLGDHRCR
jgi:hypothetical protein